MTPDPLYPLSVAPRINDRLIVGGVASGWQVGYNLLSSSLGPVPLSSSAQALITLSLVLLVSRTLLHAF